MSRHRDNERQRITAAQRGDRRAQEELARTYLPLVYNVAGRALSSHQDVEDVVQETMLQVIRALPGLRQPGSIRAWILTIAMQQVGAHQRQAAADSTAALEVLTDTGTDFEELAILRLQLSDQRRQVAEASRWLDAEDRNVLALWWQETAGHLERAETAAALETTAAYAAVRIQRMRAQLDRGRSLVAALDARPRCPELVDAAAGWDGRPSPLWRKRLDRHVRECDLCLSNSREEVAVERLLVGCGLVPVPAALTTAVLGKISATGGAATAPRPNLTSALRAKPLAAAATAAVVAIGGALAYAAASGSDQPRPTDRVVAAATSLAPSPSIAASPSPVASPSASKADAAPAKTSKAAAAPATGGCGKQLAKIWASWPMPDKGRYTNLSDGTVRDNTTCLVWQRTHAPGTYTFTAAKQYCAGLELDGGGWHLPSRVELTSIVDYRADNPAVDTGTFAGTPPRFFWTSSPWAVTKTPLRAWIINFYEGLASNAAEQTGKYHVRCARTAEGSGRPAYKISGGQVTDPATGLTWQRASAGEMPAADAAGYCAGLTLGGHDWRLPTLKELATTVDETRVSPAIDVAAFPDTPKTARYWSSTVAEPRPADRWMLGYNDGVTTYKPYETGNVRCVR
ncbi:hypothetical protein Q0Z83_026260 [Actinoplanes sichuanensis]|uniref:RNA polymerase sigma factor n=1 Tax=Actinoplanes sichuanensis TaxID=512349 RepID=A0ABW4ATN5_9ACTN|nr:sigma-70 family RNA polymerase sigma factor [Actinoplanes sichuanensis]BEL04435.1 hypothetical protein Q0Z83_026260 [Actinoplanes sichuanensis]